MTKRCAALVMGCFWLSSCAVVQVGPQGRVASDQLLVSLAVEDAVRLLDLEPVVDQRQVLLKVVSVGSVEKDLAYIREALRARVSQCGGRAVSEGHDLELVAMVQTIGSDIDRSAVGLPIPLPTVGSVALSELHFYSDSKQISRCRMTLHAYARDGSGMGGQGPVHVAHRVRNPTLFGVTLGKFTDLKELNHSRGPVPIYDRGLNQDPD